MKIDKLRSLVWPAMVCAATLTCTTSAFSQPAASQETWEYLIYNDLGLLNKAIPDPTDGCNLANALKVVGKLGWELVQFVDGPLPESGAIQGNIALAKPTPSGQQTGTIYLAVKSAGKMMAVFKRRVPHAMSGKQCPVNQ